MAELDQPQTNKNETFSVESVEGHDDTTPTASSEVRIAELTRTLEERDAAIRKLTGDLKERDSAVASVQAQAAAAVSKYREALLAASPEVPSELVTGQTVEEVDASLAEARQMVERIHKQIDDQSALRRVPSGSPLRSSPELSDLSPAAKIAYGLAKNQH